MMHPVDAQRARHGLPPIYVETPRALTQEELAAYADDVTFQRTCVKHEPRVARGQLFWVKREAA
jgi:hypothetical protein